MDEDEIVPNTDSAEGDSMADYVDPVKQAQATALLADQMRQEEESLHQQYLTGPGSGVLAMGAPRPAIAQVQGQFGQVMPTGRGFMYVGNPTPGTAEELPGTVASRLAAATAPQHTYGQPKVTSIDPTMQQFAVQERVRGAVAKGMPISDAMLLYGMGSVGRIPTPKRYQVHGVGLVDEAGRVIAKENRAARMNVPGVGLVDVSSGQVVVPSRQTTSPALLNRHRALVADLTVAKQSDDPTKVSNAAKALNDFEQQYSSQLGIGAPAAVATPSPVIAPPAAAPVAEETRVRVRSPQGKIGTIPASQLENALKKGWKKA